MVEPSRLVAAGAAPLPHAKVAPSAVRNAPLDGLRTIAIAMVVLYHFHIPGFRGGFIGVNVFFVLSGYLITSLLIRERKVTGKIRLPSFWFRRFVRLYPALIMVVLVGLLIESWVGDGGASLDPPASAAIVLTYTGNLARAYAHISQGMFSPTWSLGMEEQFYLVWPPILAGLLFLRTRRRWLIAGLAALIASSSVASILLYKDPGGSASPDIYYSPVLNIGPLTMGCLLAVAMTDQRLRKWCSGVPGFACAGLGIAGILAIQFTLDDWWKQQVLVIGVELPLVGIASVLVIAGVTNSHSPIATFMGWRPIAWFGRSVSYPLYLWHMLALTVVTSFIGGALGTLTAVILAIALAVLTHLLVERPILRLRAKASGHGATGMSASRPSASSASLASPAS